MVKICQDCGSEFETSEAGRRYCPACVKKKLSENAKRLNLCSLGGKSHSEKRAKEKQTEKVDHEIKPVQTKKEKHPICDKYCVGCIYLGKVHGIDMCCNYILATGQKRPCPAGTGCTVKQTGKKRKWSGEERKTREANKANRGKRTATCPECGAVFETTDPRQIYCSVRCNRHVAQRKWRNKQKEAKNGG